MDHKQFRFYCQTGNLSMIGEFLGDLAVDRKEEYIRGVLQLPLRSDVLEYLGSEAVRLPWERGTGLLVELLYSEEAASRNLAVELFPAFGEAALQVLQLHINDMDPDVRLFVVMALRRLAYKEAVLKVLARQLELEQEPNVVVAIVEAIGDIGGGNAEADSIRSVLASHDHPYIRFVGERALLRLGAGRA